MVPLWDYTWVSLSFPKLANVMPAITICFVCPIPASTILLCASFEIRISLFILVLWYSPSGLVAKSLVPDPLSKYIYVQGEPLKMIMASIMSSSSSHLHLTPSLSILSDMKPLMRHFFSRSIQTWPCFWDPRPYHCVKNDSTIVVITCTSDCDHSMIVPLFCLCRKAFHLLFGS